jgi:hypothetical protein
MLTRGMDASGLEIGEEQSDGGLRGAAMMVSDE